MKEAIFDIKPIDLAASFVTEQEVNLRNTRNNSASFNLSNTQLNTQPNVQVQKSDPLQDLLSKIIAENKKEDIERELADVLEGQADPKAELTTIGARIFETRKNSKPRYKSVVQKFKIQLSSQAQVERSSEFEIKEREEDFYKKVVEAIREPMTIRKATLISAYKPELIAPIAEDNAVFLPERRTEKSNLEANVASFYQKPVSIPGNLKPKLLNFSFPDFSFPAKKKFFKLWIFMILGIGILGYGLTLKYEIVKEGVSALQNLQQAQESLKNFNFSDASDDFRKSYEGFVQAGRSLNLIGAGLADVVTDLPGLDKLTGGGTGKLKSAKDIVEVGKLLADAGRAMSEALSSLSRTGAILNPADADKTKPFKIISQLRDAVLFSNRSFQKAKTLMASIDEGIIPEDKKESYYDFKSKIPVFERAIVDAVDYADFLEAVIGIDKPKKYLLLFQNYSELRPAGGFPGTYGVISFASGGLDNFFVDDVYNLDGQLGQNIVPPRQLQHITPTWGMRDAGWFADFPSSARKAMWFFSQEAGYKVDGVIALNPDVIIRILDIVGPIEMPEYKMNLTGDNFLAGIQEEVEYGENRTQPKKIVVDFAPRFLEELYSADSEQWIKIFNVFMAGLEEKDIIIYLDDKNLENFVIKKEFGGEIKGENSDFLMVAFSNIKGSKTDAVTDSSISVITRFDNNQAIHKVSINRKHNGGSSPYGFYNRQNPAYVRVLLPENAELLKISGNDFPNFRPLISYNSDFTEDEELKLFESSFYFDKNTNTDKYEESGKKGIGFWMIANPGETKTVDLEYAVPINGDVYNFYFQKQPGLDWKNFKFIIEKPEDAKTLNLLPALNRVGNKYIFDEILKKDFKIEVQLK